MLMCSLLIQSVIFKLFDAKDNNSPFLNLLSLPKIKCIKLVLLFTKDALN